MIHELPLERRTLHGHFARDLPAILTIDPGDSIAFACPNAGWRLGADEVFEPRDEELDAGHALVGPVDVRGAVAGKTLVVRIDEVRPGTFGETWGDKAQVVWTLDADADVGVDDRWWRKFDHVAVDAKSGARWCRKMSRLEQPP